METWKDGWTDVQNDMGTDGEKYRQASKQVY